MKSKYFNWTFVYSEANSLIANDIFFHGFTDCRPIPGMFDVLLYVNHKGVHICRAPLSELNRIREEGKVFLKRSYRDKFNKNISNCAKSFENLYRKFKRINLKKFTNKELLSLFKKYAEQLKLMFAYYQVSGGRCYPILEERTKENLKKYFKGSESENAYGVLLNNVEIDSLEQEDIELHYLSEKPEVSDKSLILHSKKYPLLFINMYDRKKIISSLRYRLAKYKKKRETAKEHEQRIISTKKEIKLKQKQLLKFFSDDNNIISCVEYLREQGRIRFEYKNWKNGSEYRFLSLFQEIAHRMTIPLDIMMLTHLVKDIENFLSNGILLTKDEQNNRKKISVFFQSHDGKSFASGKEAESLAHSLLDEKNTEVKELRGVTANRGKASGKARIILPVGWKDLQNQLKSFKTGEVLITTMTEPNLIFVMKKAAAIVTNQGGLTSHAAVVSRELDIPCVIGTLKATEIFKTGDMVEVDANKGVVKIIK